MSLWDLLGRRPKTVPAPRPPAARKGGGVTVLAEGEGIFGKVPWQADFLRVNAGAFSAAGFERWIEDGVGALLGAGLSLPGEVCDFFLCGHEGEVGCLGVLEASSDRVGRSFPLTVFKYVSGSALPENLLEGGGGRLANLKIQHSTEATAAEVSAQPAGKADPEDIRLGSIDWRDPEARTVLDASFARDRIAAAASLDLRSALKSLQAACQSTFEQMPERARISVELPALRGSEVGLWCQVTASLLRWKHGAPSWIWSRAAGRLLIALGPPCPELLLEWGRPGQPGSRHWVIGPGDSNARGTSSPVGKSLPPSQRPDDPAQSLADLVRGLGSEA